jgi:RNA polymerase sigma-70 factor (ECF subfamily)
MQSVDIDSKSYYLTDSVDVEQLLQLAELKAFLADSIDQLPPKCKEIFILSREENLSHKAIAKKLTLSVKTIENQISIALRKLRKMLDDSHFET